MFGFGRRRGACVACGSLFFPAFYGEVGCLCRRWEGSDWRAEERGRRGGLVCRVCGAGGARGVVCWMVGMGYVLYKVLPTVQECYNSM